MPLASPFHFSYPDNSGSPPNYRHNLLVIALAVARAGRTRIARKGNAHHSRRIHLAVADGVAERVAVFKALRRRKGHTAIRIQGDRPLGSLGYPCDL